MAYTSFYNTRTGDHLESVTLPVEEKIDNMGVYPALKKYQIKYVMVPFIQHTELSFI